MSKKMIGILAGMGPRSTAPFIDLVVDACQEQYGAKYDEDFPPMMIYSLPTPFYIDKPIDHQVMKDTIIQGLQTLQSTGVDFIAMPCNSAHIYYDELTTSLSIPLLNIVDETISQLTGDKKRVSLFATAATFDSNIYQQGITSAGHRFVFREEWQERIHKLIQGIKLNKVSPENLQLWNGLLEEARKDSIETIIIACTDLNVVVNQSSVSIPVIDSAKCLALSVVHRYYKGFENNRF